MEKRTFCEKKQIVMKDVKGSLAYLKMLTKRYIRVTLFVVNIQKHSVYFILIYETLSEGFHAEDYT